MFWINYDFYSNNGEANDISFECDIFDKSVSIAKNNNDANNKRGCEGSRESTEMRNCVNNDNIAIGEYDNGIGNSFTEEKPFNNNHTDINTDNVSTQHPSGGTTLNQTNEGNNNKNTNSDINLNHSDRDNNHHKENGDDQKRTSEALKCREELKRRIDNESWKEEWEILTHELSLVDVDECTLAAQMVENKSKSNYCQYFTFDKTRVHLAKIYDKNGVEKVGSDYVNASHIHLPQSSSQYIAAGAPSDDSIEDFWRMCWENDIKYVVMLTKLVEGRRMKSAAYWPPPVLLNSDEEDDDIFDFTDDDDFALSEGTYGNFTVQLKHQNTGAIHEDVTQRTFKIIKDACKYENEDECESRRIIQFHYSGWPDHGVPQNLDGVCSLVKTINSLYPGGKNKNNESEDDDDDDDFEYTYGCNGYDGCDNFQRDPDHSLFSKKCKASVVVHCSAGIGRTGTFLVIHSEFSRFLHNIKDDPSLLSKEKYFDILETVRYLRKQRYFMIQTEDQYLFCYRSILYLIDQHLNINNMEEKGKIQENPTTVRERTRDSDEDSNDDDDDDDDFGSGNNEDKDEGDDDDDSSGDGNNSDLDWYK